jgi:hypothetical protein
LKSGCYASNATAESGRGGDAPYIHKERANIGLLSAAAWRCGWIALEEFRHEKGGRSSKEKWVGRADLQIATDNTEEFIEAKFNWIELFAKPEKVHTSIKNVLSQATIAAEETRTNSEASNCLAVAFLAVYSRKEPDPDGFNSAIQDLILEVSKTNCHAVAWCFPKEYRYAEHDDNSCVPGIIMAISNPAYP